MNGINVEVRKEDGYYSVYAQGQRMVDRESFIVADRIASFLRTGKRDNSESSEVAESIAKHFGS